MKVSIKLAALCAALSFAAPAFAQEGQTLLPESVRLQVVQGSAVPDDCMYPASITDTTRFEIACVTMPRIISNEIGAQYIGQLGQQGWRQGDLIPAGMTAVRTDENNCERVLNIFPGPFPPGQEESAMVVMWFALDRTPRCNRSQPG